ncbi:MAG: HNH endonuclease, partial [Spongiibacteraceae bacterium]
MKLLITLLLLPLTALAGDYKRSDWPHWADLDRDCQDTRQEILAEESAKPPKYRTKKECVVDSGNWLEPYAGKVVDSPKKLDIEHIIP